MFDPSTMPVKLIPISSEDLEHIEDKKLDKAFESHLSRAGDDLLPIPGAEAIFKEYFAETEESVEESADSGMTPVRDNKAVDIAQELSEDDEEPTEMPVLPENPTDEDLIKYAQNHPSVRGLLKLFRGRVVNVRKRQ